RSTTLSALRWRTGSLNATRTGPASDAGVVMSADGGPRSVNDAVTDRGWSRVTVHTARSSPVQSPLQAPNSLAASGVATRETLVPAGKAEEQLLVHVMRAGVVLTVPPPGPATVIDSRYPNVAVTVLLPSVVT